MPSGIHQPPAAPVLHTFPTLTDLTDSLDAFIVKAQKAALDKKGRFTVAVSGGSLPTTLTHLVNNPGVKWDKW